MAGATISGEISYWQVQQQGKTQRWRSWWTVEDLGKLRPMEKRERMAWRILGWGI
jgi:hypothetical protein